MLVLALLAATAAQSCLDVSAIRSRRAESGSSVLFAMLDGKTYRNNLGGRCPGLSRANNARTLAVESEGGRICRGDRITVVDHRGPGVPCVLGTFELVEPPQGKPAG